ncbi:hypothetical protein R5W24_002748 [Gemmata sp. JC717]|uniref:Organic solvent tolerance-like N-terminal domain-containing protein n=1 Tax=Gemmata algarum TaxID=2975278 RepID=A0ABU5EVS4_9BACT|nr:hypothetical protein [Gemmata algarum]MDY3553645.1 hypothetical protein [Gemmata algarum]MDY3559329.1 hypothetical protein [Gemmata algarum]
MRARTFALMALLLALPLAAHGQDFKPFASSDGRYKIQFPGTPKTATTDVASGKDTLKLTIDSVELKGDISFAVSHIDASEEVSKRPPGPRLEKVRDAVKGENGKVLEDKEVTLSLGDAKFTGRDVVLETPNGFLRNRMVIVERRLYQVMVQGSKEVVTSETADKFINSFELTK